MIAGITSTREPIELINLVYQMYRGLQPHKIMPMPSTHKPLNATACRALASVLGFKFRAARQASR